MPAQPRACPVAAQPHSVCWGGGRGVWRKDPVTPLSPSIKTNNRAHLPPFLPSQSGKGSTPIPIPQPSWATPTFDTREDPSSSPPLWSVGAVPPLPSAGGGQRLSRRSPPAGRGQSGAAGPGGESAPSPAGPNRTEPNQTEPNRTGPDRIGPLPFLQPPHPELCGRRGAHRTAVPAVPGVDSEAGDPERAHQRVHVVLDPLALVAQLGHGVGPFPLPRPGGLDGRGARDPSGRRRMSSSGHRRSRQSIGSWN
ncbi:NADH dehydrogenase [ubiquinone] 1 beta subcomplex subunit 2, mitochondrial isoform X1 [Heliangelus exortis]|uniref:NADH dehydrogenase [ubiquinone] 1 beta subcomplex subunit 2, mitochondrial isoform X1 n=1 Tax=Heliangelus exortis TaxID=472823 RepID=UPI003A8CFCF6